MNGGEQQMRRQALQRKQERSGKHAEHAEHDRKTYRRDLPTTKKKEFKYARP